MTANQAIVKSAVSDAAESLVAFVPALGIREVFAFGEAVPLPMRHPFRQPSGAVPAGPEQQSGRTQRNGADPWRHRRPSSPAGAARAACARPVKASRAIMIWMSPPRRTTTPLPPDKAKRRAASRLRPPAPLQKMPANAGQVETLRDEDLMPQEFSALQSTLLRPSPVLKPPGSLGAPIREEAFFRNRPGAGCEKVRPATAGTEPDDRSRWASSGSISRRNASSAASSIARSRPETRPLRVPCGR